jgi:acetyl esterase
MRRPLHELSVEEARARDAAELAAVALEPVANVFERDVQHAGGRVRVRFYLPHDAPLPVLVYFFGGGWVVGSLDAVDPVCRALANATPCAVASVEYRRAPEHPFPAGLEDCYAATRWIAERGAALGLDRTRLAVGGASAGGNLAAALALAARERGEPAIAFQLLVYPPVDRRTDDSALTGGAPDFGPRDLEWCWAHYLADPADGGNPLVSPLRASNLAGLPPALVIIAEIDPIRDQAERYAARLKEAGVQTELARYAGATHGFFSAAQPGAAAVEARALAASALRRAFEIAA